ncbi:hypothetical protein [Phaeobacter sp. NW0010-22]|uniref:hypothetical protein n=1 Tax=Phaeobacter sp. NW0010-22 TaxID=3135907 RepID=UPI003104D565
MKFEIIGSAAAGFFSVAGAWLVGYGSSWEAVVVALIGATLAVIEGEGRRVGAVVGIFLFNLMIGALGGPVVAQRIRLAYEIEHPALVLLLAFLVAYVAHDLFRSSREILMNRWRKMLGGSTK